MWNIFFSIDFLKCHFKKMWLNNRYTYCGYLHSYLLGPQARPWRKSSYILGWHWEEFCQGYRPIKRRGIKKLTILVKPTVYYWRGENSITIPFEFFKTASKMFSSCRNAFNPVLDILEKAEFPNPYNGDVFASSMVLTLIIVENNSIIVLTLITEMFWHPQ